jgi:hypothetical protein
MSSRGLIGITWEGGLRSLRHVDERAIHLLHRSLGSFVRRETSTSGPRSVGVGPPALGFITRTISLGYSLYSFGPNLALYAIPFINPALSIPTPPPVRRTPHNGIDLDAGCSDTVRVRQK